MFDKSKEEMEYEERLRRRLKILQEQFKAGKVKLAEGLDVEKSLLAVRTRPDGEIDLDTVDGLVRSMALAVTAMHDREEMKKEASLSEIQNMYFQFIENNFGDFYKIMLQKGLTPNDAATALTQNKKSINELAENLEEFLGIIEEFWESVGEVAQIHLEDMHGNIKGIFGGDLFPSHNENIASKCGIYTDTIVLPDPFLRSKHIFSHYPKDSKAFYFIKHAMNILQYKDLACADVDIPIVAILPDQAALQEDERDFYVSLGKDDSLVHAGKLFGRDFASFEELMEFAQELDTIERAVAEIRDENRVLFDLDWDGDVSSQLNKALQNEHYKHFVDSPGVLLASQALGRMTVSNELLIKSRRLNGTPLIDAPTSWKYLAWKMEYDSERTESQIGAQDLHVVRGLQELAVNEMEWLGNIPPDALIDIRKQGAMDEIRSMLGNGINDIVDANPVNFQRSRDQIFENINDAFTQHRKNIDVLKAKNWKFAGKDMGSWMVMGSLGVAAAVTGMPVWGLAAIAADQLLDAPKLKDIPKSIRQLADESNKVKKSPVGMLFSVSKKKFN
ncbi:hypothetical protein AB4395_12595 [Vibrio splendidus]|uniref:hypothetical protein n=1 Tax=Vibrio splendidus TaxID=29497 RepID=UPI001E49B420|nr:hypothetical protein [Vibrio splendidus]MCC4881305.1 hypothetical protein [Vibrio splendidus]UOE86138.1 hypothetical protein LTQ54_20770 [Vibrio splendidus]UOE91038.1 hypothetical protein LTQ02_23080 [Vibrio splendidus]